MPRKKTIRKRKSLARSLANLIWKIPLGIIIFALYLAFFQYLFSVFYEFPEPTPFQGRFFVNPYENVKENKWKKANFHAHTYAWAGITNGKTTPEQMRDVYAKLGYEIISISDYQKINAYFKNDDFYIPVYEHGYGIRKTHQLSIGARKATLLDYPFFQTLHHKQHIIEKLSTRADLVALAHPLFHGAYTKEELKYLTGYHLVEVLSNYRQSFDHWDTALSNGHAVFIVGNDDSHDINDLTEAGRHATMIYAENARRAEIVEALKSGAAYGIEVKVNKNQSLEDKINDHENIPFLLSLQMEASTVTITVSKKASDIKFIGQNGALIHSVTDANTASYRFTENDTYIRAEAHFDNKYSLFFNPVYRTDGKMVYEGYPIRNVFATVVFRMLSIPVFLFLVLFPTFRFLKRNKLIGGRKKRK